MVALLAMIPGGDTWCVHVDVIPVLLRDLDVYLHISFSVMISGSKIRHLREDLTASYH